MKNRIKKSLSLLFAVIMLLCAVPFTGLEFTANAATSGYLTYETYDNQAYITECNTEAKGKLTIPTKIKGFTVAGIRNEAFNNCSELTSIVIPNGVTFIGSHAFAYCTKLTDITIPNTVDEIETSAFYHCESLTSINIPKSVEKIGVSLFCGCTKLKTVTVDSRNPVFQSKNNCIINKEEKTLVAGCKSSIIPSDGSVTRIGDRAFEGCTVLTNITIPGCVKEIGWAAFYYCTGLKRVTLQNGVEIIGSGSFQKCEKLANITLPNSIRTIRDYAFGDCSNLTAISIPEGVEIICAAAFYNSAIEAVTIPSSVTSFTENEENEIGDLYGDFYYGFNPFPKCQDLKSIVVDSKNPAFRSDGNCIIDTKREWLVSGCQNSVIPSDGNITTIKVGAFCGCTGLKSIVIPGTIKVIENSAFYECSGLKSVVMKDGVENIWYDAFRDCLNLSKAVIPDSVKSIGECAFVNTSLKTVTLPQNLEEIKRYAIGYNCEWSFSTVTGFVVKGYPGTAAEKYAKDNGLKFVSLDEHTHTFNKGVVTKKATCNSRGIKTFTCTECGATKNKAIAKIDTVKLFRKNFAYTGKALKPKVIIKDANGKQLRLGSDYTVKYRKNKNIGKATVIITFKGNYEGTKRITFNIVPTAPNVKVAAGKKTATLKFSSASGADSYTIYYSASKNSGYKKIATTAKTAYRVKNLKSGRTYYFKVVARKTVGKNTFRSVFSSPKKAAIK